MNGKNNKSELRKIARAKRDGFSNEFVLQASMRACKILAQTREFANADTLLFYYPIKNELSPLPLIQEAKKMGKQIAFPVCNTSSNTLEFKCVNETDELLPSIFGLLEPKDNNKTATITKNTLCIVPALLFSKNGQRLGYGKGYYDRFLQDFKGISIGFSYDKLLVDEIPSCEHDIPLDMIITESEVLYIAEKD